MDEDLVITVSHSAGLSEAGRSAGEPGTPVPLGCLRQPEGSFPSRGPQGNA